MIYMYMYFKFFLKSKENFVTERILKMIKLPKIDIDFVEDKSRLVKILISISIISLIVSVIGMILYLKLFYDIKYMQIQMMVLN